MYDRWNAKCFFNGGNFQQQDLSSGEQAIGHPVHEQGLVKRERMSNNKISCIATKVSKQVCIQSMHNRRLTEGNVELTGRITRAMTLKKSFIFQCTSLVVGDPPSPPNCVREKGHILCLEPQTSALSYAFRQNDPRY